MENRAGTSGGRFQEDEIYEIQEETCSFNRELTSEERKLLADLYHFIIYNDEEEVLAELKEEKYKTLLNVDIPARSCICGSWIKYEGFSNCTDHHTVDEVEGMIRTGYCPHAGPPEEKTQLMSFQIIHLAAIYGMTRVIEYLLTSCNGNVNCLTERLECPPLAHAVYYGNETTALNLLDRGGANPNRVLFLNSFLMEAMSSGCDRVVKRLLCDKTCDVNATDKKGRTAVIVAVCRPVSQDAKDLVILLIQAGCDVNIKDDLGLTALFYAINNKDFGMVEILLKAGASVNVEDNKGLCPLLLAIYRGDIEITKLILEAGADPNSRNENGFPVLTIASDAGDGDLVWMLLKHKADVNATNLNHYYSALRSAAWGGYKACVKYLLEAGATHDKKTRDGNTPLSLAAHGGHPDVIDMLLPLGCDVTNTDKDLDTPLHYAAFKGCLKTATSMVDGGADVNARNASNATPLWNAVHNGHTNVVRYLVRKNAELNVASRGIDQLRTSLENHSYIYDEPKTLLATVFDGDDILIGLLLMAGYDIWHEKCLFEFTTTPISSSPDVQTAFQTIMSHVFTPPSLFHLCKMSLRNTHKLTLEEFMRKQKIPKTITNNIILEGIEKRSQKIPLDSFGKIF